LRLDLDADLDIGTEHGLEVRYDLPDVVQDRSSALLPVAVLPGRKAELEEAYLANALFTAPKDGPEFGYRFHADEVRDAGHSVADRTVWRICSEHSWWSVVGRSAARTASRALPPHDDLAQRDFTAAANQPTPMASDWRAPTPCWRRPRSDSDHAELLHHPQVVADRPVLSDLAVAKPEHVSELD
jgi:hypothetical protein